MGVLLVWVADPESHRVRAYRSPSDARERCEEDTVTGDEVLPGFEASVAQFLEEQWYFLGRDQPVALGPGHWPTLRKP